VESNAPTFAEILELTHPTAEATVLAGMMADTETAIELAQSLEPSDFYNERAGVIFQAIRGLLMGIEPLDKPAILAECRQIISERKLKLTVNESHLVFEGDPRRAVSYAQTVKRLAWLRGAAGFASWMIDSLQARPDPDNLFAEAQERWTAIRPVQQSTSFVYGWDTMKLHDDAIRERAKPESDTLRCNWPWQTWNQIVRPLRPGMVGIVTAPDGMGKSSALEMVAEHWAMLGIQTVLVHLEDDLEYKLDRRMARHARVPMERIEDGDFSAAESAAIREAGQRMSKFADRLHYYHAPGKSMVEIIRELETRASEGVCQAVVFDYLDKTQATRAQAKIHGTNTWERQADDMEQLKTFAERNRVPVMTATQGNKSMQNAGTQTRQAIQGSGQKSQKSQLVIVLTRDLVGDQGLQDKNGNRIAEPGDYSPIVNVRVDKQNRGRTGQFKQIIAGRFFTIRDPEEHRSAP
jgi:replicative DNA helicase